MSVPGGLCLEAFSVQRDSLSGGGSLFGEGSLSWWGGGVGKCLYNQQIDSIVPWNVLVL